MKTLLEYFLKYFEVLYLDSRYHITNSNSNGVATTDASLQLTGPTLSWDLTNDKGQMLLSVAPTELASPSNWFRISLIKQYLDKEDEIEHLSAMKEIKWIYENSTRVEQLFLDASLIENTCETLNALRRSNANRYWTRWREQQGLT